VKWKRVQPILHIVNPDLSVQAACCVPDLIIRPINQQLIVRHPLLQQGLTSADVTVQCLKVVPERVIWHEMNAGIEQPARPIGLLRGKGCAMIEHMVDPRQKQLLHLWLAIGKLRAEMDSQPEKSVSGNKLFTAHMACRTGKPEHKRLRTYPTDYRTIAP